MDQTLVVSPKCTEPGSQHSRPHPPPSRLYGGSGQALAVGERHEKDKFARGIYPFMSIDYGPELIWGHPALVE